MDIYEKLARAIENQKAGNFATAEKSYLDVIEQDPGNSDAHNLLGCLYKSKGDIDKGIANISIAISSSKNQTIFFNNLGTCYLEKKEMVAAELCFRQALALDPKNLDALNNLGTLLLEQREFGEAALILERGRVYGNQDENILANLSAVYLRLNRVDQALQVAEQGLSFNSASVQLMIAKASVLAKMNQSAQALDLLDSISAAPPLLRAAILKLKASLLEVVGKLDDAVDTYDLALSSAPTDIALLFARVQIRKVIQGDTSFQQLLELERSASKFAGLEKTQLYFGLAKAYQDAGDFAQAAKKYALGSAHHLQTSKYNEAADYRIFSAFQEAFTPQYLQSLEGLGSDSERPIFIVGMPRSGTTLIEQILASHPDVFPAGELHFISEAADGMMLPGNWKLNRSAEHSIQADANLLQRAESYLAKVNAISGSNTHPHVTDKMPENYLNIGLITAMFPKARIIHCRRDPIDTCISNYITLFANQHYWSFNFGMLGRTYRHYWEIMQHWRNVLPGRFLELRYEDVITDTEGVARKLLAWCNLSWDDRVLRFYETDRPVTTASVTQVRQPIYKTSAGRWKKWEPYIRPLLDEIRDIEVQYWNEANGKP